MVEGTKNLLLQGKYCAQNIQFAISLYKTDITSFQIYDKDQLEAMQLAKTTWEDVNMTTIQNCWQKAGILPDINPVPLLPPFVPISNLLHADNLGAWYLAISDLDPVAEVKKKVSKALDYLEVTRMLQ